MSATLKREVERAETQGDPAAPLMRGLLDLVQRPPTAISDADIDRVTSAAVRGAALHAQALGRQWARRNMLWIAAGMLAAFVAGGLCAWFLLGGTCAIRGASVVCYHWMAL